MIAALFILFLLAVSGKVLGSRFGKLFPYLCAATLVSFFIYFLHLSLKNTLPYKQSLSWFPKAGINLDLQLDGLSLLFSLLISFIGAGVFLYAADYMKSYNKTSGLFSTLILFTGAMLGLVLSNNLILFFIFWEMTSLTSYLLIGFKSGDATTRDSARTALFVTFVGGLFLLLGIIFVSLNAQSLGLEVIQSFQFDQLQKINLLEANNSYNTAAIFCFALAVATKSAQFPFHFWLPFAMAGPTPVSSFLHSATMVKAGVFLLFRLSPLYSSHPAWNIFIILGASTMLVTALLALSQRDVKKILAYTTTSVLGILVLLIGLGTEYALKAALVFVTAHALYKAALFQIVGNIDFSLGERNIDKLRGLFSLMPLTAIAAFLSALSMAGVPPFFGFFGKELLYFSKINLGELSFTLSLLAFLANVFLTGLAFALCFHVFWGKRNINQDLIKDYRKVPFMMALPPLCYSLVGILIGLFPVLFYAHLGTSAFTQVMGTNTEMKLKLWHGTNPDALLVLALSFITLALGTVVSIKLRAIITFLSRLKQKQMPFTFKELFDKALNAIHSFSIFVSRLVHHGSLKGYLKVYLVTTTLLISLNLFKFTEFTFFSSINLVEIMTGIVLSVPIISLIATKGKLAQTILLAVGGLGLVFFYAMYSAIDVALTQLMVESLSIFFLFFLLKKSLNFERKKNNSPIDYIIAATFSFVLFFVLVIPPIVTNTKVMDFFLKNSLSQAFGQNVVNVILVDFRALDTFGEIIVIVAALISVHILLNQDKKRGPE